MYLWFKTKMIYVPNENIRTVIKTIKHHSSSHTIKNTLADEAIPWGIRVA